MAVRGLIIHLGYLRSGSVSVSSLLGFLCCMGLCCTRLRSPSVFFGVRFTCFNIRSLLSVVFSIGFGYRMVGSVPGFLRCICFLWERQFSIWVLMLYRL